MILYGWSGSRTRRCLWTLEEIGAEFTFKFIDRNANEHRAPDFLRINPNGRVPALIDGSVVLFESAAICNHIARKYPEHGLIPAIGSPEYSTYEQWMFWITGELEQPLWAIGKHRFALPEEFRISDMERVAAYEWEQVSTVLRDRIDGPFLVGDRFSVVDILAAHTLYWAEYFGLPLHDTLVEYLALHSKREAFQRTFSYP